MRKLPTVKMNANSKIHLDHFACDAASTVVDLFLKKYQTNQYVNNETTRCMSAFRKGFTKPNINPTKAITPTNAQFNFITSPVQNIF